MTLKRFFSIFRLTLEGFISSFVEWNRDFIYMHDPRYGTNKLNLLYCFDDKQNINTIFVTEQRLINNPIRLEPSALDPPPVMGGSFSNH